MSWRFKPLDSAWPFVLITHPTDRRLVTQASRKSDNAPVVRAKLIGDAPMRAVEMRVNDGTCIPMRPVAGQTALWDASAPATLRQVTVRARDADGRLDEDHVEPAEAGWSAPKRQADGSDADRVGAWPEREIFDTQLGPNRNGRKW